MKTKRMTVSELARLWGVSHQAAGKQLRRDGAPPRGPDGKYAVAAADAFHDGQVEQDCNDPTLAELRRQIAAERLTALERDNAVADGRLVSLDAVTRANVECGGVIRSTLLNAGNELAPALAGKDPRQVKALLDAWADRTLNTWADWAQRHSKAEGYKPA